MVVERSQARWHPPWLTTLTFVVEHVRGVGWATHYCPGVQLHDMEKSLTFMSFLSPLGARWQGWKIPAPSLEKLVEPRVSL